MMLEYCDKDITKYLDPGEVPKQALIDKHENKRIDKYEVQAHRQV